MYCTKDTCNKKKNYAENDYTQHFEKNCNLVSFYRKLFSCYSKCCNTQHNGIWNSALGNWYINNHHSDTKQARLSRATLSIIKLNVTIIMQHST